MQSFLPDVNQKIATQSKKAFERKTSEGRRVGVNYTCYKKRIPGSQSIQFRFGPQSNKITDSQKAMSTQPGSNFEYAEHDMNSDKNSFPLDSNYNTQEPSKRTARSNVRPSYKGNLQKSPLLISSINTSRLPKSIANKLLSDRGQRQAQAFRMYGDPKAAQLVPLSNNYLNMQKVGSQASS